MQRATSILCAFAGLFLSQAACAQSVTIGVAAPLSGPSALLGQQILAGAEAAAAQPEQAGITLDVADDACTAEGGAKAAQKLTAAKVRIVTGFLCTEAIEAALPILKQAGIPVITPGVRTDSLTDRRKKTGWLVWRLGPRGDSERAAAATLLTRLWRENLFAVIDDGTIYGRELAESFRAAAEQTGLKPVFVDTFRPQLDNQVGLVGRLRKAGATHVFVGGDRDDIAIMTRDAKQLGAEITFAGGEALRAPASDVALEPGTLMVALPEWREVADRTVIKALDARGMFPDGYMLPSYAALQVAAAALAAEAKGQPLAVALGEELFDTAIGPVKFDSKGDLAENPYRVWRFDGTRFLAAEGL